MSAPAPVLARFAASGSVLIGDPRADRAVLAVRADNATAFTVEQLDALAGSPVVLALADDLAVRLGLADAASVDAAFGIGDGRSAADRARTLRAAASPRARAQDLVTPGHVQLVRDEAWARNAAGAAVALAGASGRRPAAALALLVDEAGNPVAPADARRLPQLAHVPFAWAAELHGASEAQAA
jgi:3,4-dihydroxy-2-butanone 4-phosphate synthase